MLSPPFPECFRQLENYNQVDIFYYKISNLNPKNKKPLRFAKNTWLVAIFPQLHSWIQHCWFPKTEVLTPTSLAIMLSSEPARRYTGNDVKKPNHWGVPGLFRMAAWKKPVGSVLWIWSWTMHWQRGERVPKMIYWEIHFSKGHRMIYLHVLLSFCEVIKRLFCRKVKSLPNGFTVLDIMFCHVEWRFQSTG